MDIKTLEKIRAEADRRAKIHLEIERTHTSYPKDWHEGNRNALYDMCTYLDSEIANIKSV